MTSVRALALSSCLAAGLAAAASAADAPRVAGEPSRTPVAKSAATWRHAGFPDASLTRLRYGEMSAERILGLAKANANRIGKPLQIGIARDAAHESAERALPPLAWVSLADGSSVARVQLLSPLAYGIRAGLRFERLDPRAELRFSGSQRPGVVVASMRGDQMAALVGDDDLFWTPGTDGEKQFVEVWIPAGVARDAVAFSAPRLSHLMTNARDDFRILEKIGESGSCNIDAVCRVPELGQPFANAKAAVARITFVLDGLSYMCTGTLLNDTDASTQVPYFHTAHHCIGSQSVASTLNSYWRYESTACGAGSVGDYVLLGGGADHLYSNAETDGALLRLRDAAPAGSAFAGWDANPIPASAAVTTIHHPSGDLKKVSFGQHVPGDSDPTSNAVGWLEGTTESGSSGSGLFTRDADGYRLRGGLHGGDASYGNSGALNNTGNRDWYSRFDVDFPNIRRYLAPAAVAPRRRNGAQPLSPP